MDLKNWEKQLKETFQKAGAAFSGLVSRVLSLFQIRRVLDSFLGRFPVEKRRPILFGLGIAIVFIVLAVSFLALNSGGRNREASPEVVSGPLIPPEDLFLPGEPDFVPKFLIERPPRSFWTLDDIGPYWKDPERTGRWQDEISSTVDKLMEGVP